MARLLEVEQANYIHGICGEHNLFLTLLYCLVV